MLNDPSSPHSSTQVRTQSRRRTLTVEDVNFALRLRGQQPLYGYGGSGGGEGAAEEGGAGLGGERREELARAMQADLPKVCGRIGVGGRMRMWIRGWSWPCPLSLRCARGESEVDLLNKYPTHTQNNTTTTTTTTTNTTTTTTTITTLLGTPRAGPGAALAGHRRRAAPRAPESPAAVRPRDARAGTIVYDFDD